MTAERLKMTFRDFQSPKIFPGGACPRTPLDFARRFAAHETIRGVPPPQLLGRSDAYGFPSHYMYTLTDENFENNLF